MLKVLTSAMVLGCLAACGGGGYGGGAGTGMGSYPAGGPPISPSADATVSLSATNYDGVDYALWIQWQDNFGNLNQDFVAILPAAPAGSMSQVVQDIPVNSGIPYSLLLLDPWGNIWDSLSLGILNPGDVLPLNVSAVNGAFLVS